MKRFWILGLTLGLLGALNAGSAVFADVAAADAPVTAEPVTYVTLDAGAGLELTLDDSNTVIEVTPLDPEGAGLIPEEGLVGLPVEEAVDQLVDEAVDSGLLPADGSVPVEIGIGSDDPEAVEEVTDALTDEPTGETPAEETPVPVVFQNAALERIALARELGITPGKLNLIQKYAASTGSPETVVLADWTQKPVKEIMGAVKANRKAAPVPEDPTPETGTEVTKADSTAAVTAAPGKAPKTEAPKAKGNSKNGGGKKK